MRSIHRSEFSAPAPGRGSSRTPNASPARAIWGSLATVIGLVLLTVGLVHLGVPRQPQAYSFLYLAVVAVAAGAVGFSAALAGSVASAILVDFYFLPPVGHLTIYSTNQTVGWIIFLLVCLGVAALATTRRRHLLALQSIAGELEQRNLTLKRSEVALEQSLEARTELARTEAALAATRRAETFRRDLLATVSHELRTPLSALLGYSTALAEHSQAERQGLEEYPALIAAEARRIDRLIGDLLEMARIESGQLHVESQVIDLGEAAREAALRWAQKLDVTVSAPSTPVLVFADWDRVQQILDNALRNVTVHADIGSAEVLVNSPSGSRRTAAECLVRDRGVGIPLEVRTRLFERYSAAGKTGGLGLGLALSRGLAEAMGGALWIDNPTNGGTELHLLVPLAPSAAQETASPTKVAR
ncbi:MAG: sensor histidine kinase [Candidatus Dormibacteria bacterium]